jgi:hypothetical protein
MLLEFWTALTGNSATSKVKGNATTGAIYVEQLNSSGGAGTAHGRTVTITRPANTTPYTALDVIGDTNGSAIFEFTNMGKAGGEVMITSVEVEVDVVAVPSGMTSFNLRLYNASPTAIVDNAAWDFPVADRGKYLGKITTSNVVDEISTLFCDNDQVNKQVTLVTTSLFVQLQTVGGFTPSANSTVKRVTIHTIEL